MTKVSEDIASMPLSQKSFDVPVFIQPHPKIEPKSVKSKPFTPQILSTDRLSKQKDFNWYTSEKSKHNNDESKIGTVPIDTLFSSPQNLNQSNDQVASVFATENLTKRMSEKINEEFFHSNNWKSQNKLMQNK